MEQQAVIYTRTADFWGPILSPIGEAEVWAMCIAGVCIILDILFGLAKAAKGGTLSSKVMREGLWHKSAFVGVVALACLLQVGSVHLDMGFDAPLVIPACTYIVVNEVMSMVESLAELNPEIKGSKLLQLFESGKSSEDEKGE